jgi:8-oxo-dGTP pyrophosphatase MutT (NUDIX family)
MSAIEKLKKLIAFQLPGESAHAQMAPLNRPLSSIAKSKSDNYRESSVAVILVNLEEIILIQRPEYEGNHSGQVSFPGGKKEESDQDLFETALRESQEEIGIQLPRENYLGKLTPVFIPVSNFHVEAHVFILQEQPNFIKDDYEVSEIFSIKITELLDDSKVKYTDMKINREYTLNNIPYFDLENKIIWGATALILNELKELLKMV